MNTVKTNANFCVYVHVRIFLEGQPDGVNHVIQDTEHGSSAQWLRAGRSPTARGIPCPTIV